MVLSSPIPKSHCVKRALTQTSFFVAPAALFYVLTATDAVAQTVRDDHWVQRLPRPGYEQRGLRQGSFVILPELRVAAVADSNVFATSQNEESDEIFFVEPSIEISRNGDTVSLKIEGQSSIRRFSENTRENVDLYGFKGEATVMARQDLTAKLAAGYNRGFQRRDDPESQNNLNLPPTYINMTFGEAGLSWRPGRIGLGARIGANKADYVEAIESDQDRTTTRASIRATAALSSRIDAFAEGYGVDREFRLGRDRSGRDRDSRTYGALAGLAFDITDTLEGEIGAGWFTARLDDPTLDDFSGLSAEGQLRWSPQARTGVIFNVSRGDQATVRAGASGRIDTVVGAEIVQEIRHNLLGRASLSYRHRQFRASTTRTEDDFTARAGIEYLLNRHVALAADYTFGQREATAPTDEFERKALSLALTLRY